VEFLNNMSDWLLQVISCGRDNFRRMSGKGQKTELIEVEGKVAHGDQIIAVEEL
jgi:hypothetical protein